MNTLLKFAGPKLITLVALASTVVATLASPTVDAQSVYRWVDKDGKVYYGDTPPPDNKSVQQKNVKGGTGIPNPENLPLAVREAMERNPISVFLTNCGELCNNARALLAKRGVPYTVRDPEKNPADYEALNKVAGGQEVPFLQVGTRNIRGFTEESWNSALDAAGYPRVNVFAKPPEPKKSEMPKDKQFEEPGKAPAKDAPKSAPPASGASTATPPAAPAK